jgi:GntR family transcriptional regulator
MSLRTRQSQGLRRAKPGSRGQAIRPDEPLYRQLADTLRGDIVGGRYPVGALLPTEDELRERFSVSRFTVREAIRRLRDEGLVSSRQGAGTTVSPSPASAQQALNTVSIGDILAFGAGTRFVMQSIRMAKLDGRQAKRIGAERGEQWLAVTGFRRTEHDATPICWVEYFIHADFASVGRQLPRHAGPIFPLIEDVFAVTITEVQQEISATVLGPSLADQLQVAEGSAALEIRRVYRIDSTRIAQVTFNTHPASTYRHSMTMRRLKR